MHDPFLKSPLRIVTQQGIIYSHNAIQKVHQYSLGLSTVPPPIEKHSWSAYNYLVLKKTSKNLLKFLFIRYPYLQNYIDYKYVTGQLPADVLYFWIQKRRRPSGVETDPYISSTSTHVPKFSCFFTYHRFLLSEPLCSAHTAHLSVLYRSRNNERLLPCTALTQWFL
jgi:hypothetical protein